MSSRRCKDTCRIALMSYPDPYSGVVRRPLVTYSWSMVLSSISAAINSCVRFEQQGAVDYISGRSFKMSKLLSRSSTDMKKTQSAMFS